jgi:O-antigen ligase
VAAGSAGSHFCFVTEQASHTTVANHFERLAVGALLITPLLPLVFAPGVVFPYVTIRVVLFRVLVLVAAWCAAVIALLRRSGAWRRDPVALALAGMFGTAAISAFAGAAAWHSWFGDFERMGGVIAWLSYLAYYLLLLRFLRGAAWKRFFQIAAAAGAIAAVFAWLEYFGAFTALGYVAGRATSSTIGNSGLFAPYVAFTAAFGLILAAEARSRGGRAVYTLLAALSVSGVWLAQNRSTVIGLALGCAAGVVAYMVCIGWSRRRVFAFAALAMVAGLAGVFALRAAARSDVLPVLPGVTARLARAAESGDPLRIVQWRATWHGFTQRPVLGWGPENHHLVWSANYDPAIYGLDPLARWDRAHNAFLEALATTGVPGALATVALWIAIFVTLFRARARGGLSPSATAILLAINVAYAAYLFFWFYDINSTMLWLAAAAFTASRAAAPAPARESEPSEGTAYLPEQEIADLHNAADPPRWRTGVLIAATTVAALAILYVHAFETLRAAHAVERLAARPPPLARGIHHLRVLGSSPAPQSLELFTASSAYLARALRRDSAAVTRGDTTPPALRREAVTITLALAERELRRDPRNERVALHAGRVALLGASVYEDPSLYNLAIGLARRAVDMNPRNVQVRLVLANFHLLTGDRRNAEEQFVRASQIFPGYAEPRRAATRGYAAVGMYRDAARWLAAAHERGVTVEAGVATHIARALNETGFAAEGLALMRRHVALRLGVFGFWDSAVGRSGATMREEFEQALLLAALERAAGNDRAGALASAAAAHVCPLSPCDSQVPLADIARPGGREPTDWPNWPPIWTAPPGSVYQ